MILSIDVGIKNLSYCLFEIHNNDYIIKQWDVINLINFEKPMICQHINKNKKCKNKALYSFKDTFRCGSHIKGYCKNTNVSLAPDEYYKINKNNSLSCKNITCIKNKIPLLPEDLSDNDILAYIKEHFVIKVPKLSSASDITLLELSKSIHFNLPKILPLKEIKTILIENQIGPLANRMKSIQGMLTQFFVEKNIYDIHFVSSQNKLKPYKLGKLSYKERKTKSIDITKNILEKNNSNWLELFFQNKKKDDLADSFLQGIWYIKYR